MKYPSLLVAAAVLLLCPSGGLRAQELEPRAYSPAPVGTNFLVGGYSHSSGDVLVDPSLPLTDVNAQIEVALLGYVRTIGLFGRSASLGVVVPRAWIHVTGDVGGEGREVNRDGLGDPRLRLAVNLLGGPAVTPEQFAEHKPSTTLGASLSVIAPYGQYEGEHLINIGTNRWSFKPEIGMSQPLGKGFLEAAAGAWLFTDNTDFFGGHRRAQETLWSFQFHGGYTFRPGLWLAGDATYYTGGRSSVDGVKNQNRQENSRYGLTLAVPMSKSFSAKLAWSTGLTTRIGGDFDVYALVLQYRWFDHRRS